MLPSRPLKHGFPPRFTASPADAEITPPLAGTPRTSPTGQTDGLPDRYVDSDACTIKPVGIDGGGRLRLTVDPPDYDRRRPAFSPNGKTLASVLDGASCDLYLVNLDLSRLTTADDTIAFARLLRWQAALDLLIWPYYLGLAAVASN